MAKTQYSSEAQRTYSAFAAKWLVNHAERKNLFYAAARGFFKTRVTKIYC